MLDIKLSMVELEVAQPSPHAASKINSLARHSIQQYQAYIDTLKSTVINMFGHFLVNYAVFAFPRLM
jgi:hypothetical protein